MLTHNTKRATLKTELGILVHWEVPLVKIRPNTYIHPTALHGHHKLK
jgi:hypothetical protein